MAEKFPFLFVFVSAVLLLCFQESQCHTSAHLELKKKGFPIGLLPKNVIKYSLDNSTGAFSVNLDDLCRFSLPPDNYIATYSKILTGMLVEGRISNLDGIRVRAFFRWWSITGIRSTGEDLMFEVGMVTVKYPSKNFAASPECEGRSESA